MRLRIDEAIVERLAGHARQCESQEACALLVGREAGGAIEVIEAALLANADPSPRTRYTIAPLEFLRVEREARARGLQVVGIFHSHPRGAAELSPFDRERAWPYYAYVVRGASGPIAAFRAAASEEPFETLEIEIRPRASEPPSP